MNDNDRALRIVLDYVGRIIAAEGMGFHGRISRIQVRRVDDKLSKMGDVSLLKLSRDERNRYRERAQDLLWIHMFTHPVIVNWIESLVAERGRPLDPQEYMSEVLDFLAIPAER